MTLNEYGAKVTEIMDDGVGQRLAYPPSFESDVAACFQKRLTPEQAAEEIKAQYGWV